LDPSRRQADVHCSRFLNPRPKRSMRPRKPGTWIACETKLALHSFGELIEIRFLLRARQCVKQYEKAQQ